MGCPSWRSTTPISTFDATHSISNVLEKLERVTSGKHLGTHVRLKTSLKDM